MPKPPANQRLVHWLMHAFGYQRIKVIDSMKPIECSLMPDGSFSIGWQETASHYEWQWHGWRKRK